jgi:hypothetical protein
MIGTAEFAVYDSGVSGIGLYCGAPSNFGTNVGPPVLGNVAVCGTELAMAASCACGVPATDASTAAAGAHAAIVGRSGFSGGALRAAKSSVHALKPAAATSLSISAFGV